MGNEKNELITNEQSIVDEFQRVFHKMLDQPEIEDRGQDNVVFITIE